VQVETSSTRVESALISAVANKIRYTVFKCCFQFQLSPVPQPFHARSTTINNRFTTVPRPCTEVATLPTDYVAGTGMHAQIMTLFRRHSRAVQVESV
jgi:hypothetical protein